VPGFAQRPSQGAVSDQGECDLSAGGKPRPAFVAVAGSSAAIRRDPAAGLTGANSWSPAKHRRSRRPRHRPRLRRGRPCSAAASLHDERSARLVGGGGRPAGSAPMALAMGVAIAASQFAGARSGLVDLGQVDLFCSRPFSAPVMVFLGGPAVRLIGMVMCRNGCGSRAPAWLLLGRGNLRSLVVVIISRYFRPDDTERAGSRRRALPWSGGSQTTATVNSLPALAVEFRFSPRLPRGNARGFGMSAALIISFACLRLLPAVPAIMGGQISAGIAVELWSPGGWYASGLSRRADGL